MDSVDLRKTRIRRFGYIGALSAAVLLVGYTSLTAIGINPKSLHSLPSMMTAIGAKLGCSAYFVSGLGEQKLYEDIAAYSPALKLLSIEIDERPASATATLFGYSSTTARYQPSLGCTLERGQPPFQLSFPASTQLNLPWPAGNSVTTIDSPTQSTLERLAEQDFKDGLDTRAYVVVHRGEIVAEYYGKDVTENTALLGWSMAKSLTGIIAANLEYNGLLDWQESHLFPEWAHDERRDITVTNLMTMTTGLEFDESYQAGTDATNMLFEDLSAAYRPVNQKLHRKPGTYWAYSSGTSNILSALISHKLGGPQATYQYLSENIYKPLGIQSMIFEPDPSGVPVGSSYLFATARDWARLGQLMINEGTLNGHQIVDAEWTKLASRPNSSSNYTNYGHQFWLNTEAKPRWPSLPTDAYAAMGNRKQMVMMIPSEQLVIVRLGWTSSRYPFDQRLSAIVDAVNSLDTNKL